MQKKRLFVELLTTVLLVSCGDVASEAKVARKIWNDNEIQKIDEYLFKDANKLIPCFALDEFNILPLEANISKGILISTKEATEDHLNELINDLLTMNYTYQNNDKVYNYKIDESSYLSCKPYMEETSLNYEVYFINDEEVPPILEDVRRSWTQEEKDLINNAFGEGIDVLFPCYAFDDAKLNDYVAEYGCISLETTKQYQESDVANFINVLKENDFVYFENGDFYYRFKDLKEEQFVSIQAYLEPDTNNFIIDYYLADNYKVNEYKRSFTFEEENDINSALGDGVASLLPVYFTDLYYLDLETFEGALIASTYADLKIIESYDKLLKENKYTYVEDIFPYYEYVDDNYTIQASFVYYASGILEIAYIVVANSDETNVRTVWNEEEIVLFNKTFNADISSLVPCFIPDGGFLDVYEDKENDIKCLFIQSPNGTQGLVNTLTNKLLEVGYSAEYDNNNQDYTYYYDINETTYINVDVYLYDGYFNYDIYYISDEVGGEVVPGKDNVTKDITLTSKDFSTGYPSCLENVNLYGMNASYERILSTNKNEVACLQFSSMKKGAGIIYNQNQLPEINTIKLTKVLSGFNAQDTSYLSVYKSNDGKNYTLVNSEDHITYNLDGATYFKIVNENDYAQYYSEIVIDFKKL